MTVREMVIASAETELGGRASGTRIRFAALKDDYLREHPEKGEAEAVLNYAERCLDYRAMNKRPPAGLTELAGEKYAYLFKADDGELETICAENRVKAASVDGEIERATGTGKYYCKICRDSGYVGASGGEQKRCSCFRDILAEKMEEVSGLPYTGPGAAEISFDLYSDRADPQKYGADESPRKNAIAAYRKGKGFASPDDPHRLLFITGKVGVGKTRLASAIGSEAIRNSMLVCYSGVSALLDSLQNRFFNSDEEQAAYRTRREFIETADMLIVDDLGVENYTDRRFESLISLLDARSGDGRKTVVTSNLGLADIADIYGERLASRFIDRDNTINIRLLGDDLRFVGK